MQMILMLLAFAAVVLLVLALYPVIMRQITGESSGGVAEAVSRQDVQKKYSYPLICCAAVFAVLLISGIDFVVALIAALAVGVLTFMLMSRIMTSRKRKREAFFESRMLDFLVLVCNNLRSGFALIRRLKVLAACWGLNSILCSVNTAWVWS